MSAEQVKQGYKRTEVGVIPEDWRSVNLDAVCSMKSGEGITAERIDEFSAYPCYGGNGLRGYTSRYTHNGRFALIGRQGALCGNINLVQGKFYASEHAVVATPKAGVDISYLAYVLGEMRLNRYTESSAQPGLSVSKVLALRLSVPGNVDEQRTIADALSDVDALLAQLDQLIAKKRDLKQATMQQLLTGQTRLPGFSGEWEVKRIDQICSLRTERVDPRTEGAQEFCIELEHIEPASGRLLGSSIASEQASLKTKFKIGDVLFGKLRAYQRKHWIARLRGVCSTEIWVLVSNAEFLTPEFLYHLVSTDDFIEAASTAYGTHMPRSDWKVVRQVQVALPSLDEQTAIATVLSDMDTELAALEARRDKTRALKQGMMQELLTGRIRLA